MPGTKLTKEPSAEKTIVVTDKNDRVVKINLNTFGVESILSINNCHLNIDQLTLAALAAIFGNSVRQIERSMKKNEDPISQCIGDLHRLLGLKKRDFISEESSDETHNVYLGIEFNNSQGVVGNVTIMAAKMEVSDAFIDNFELIRDIVERCPTHSTGKYFIYTKLEFDVLLESEYSNFSITEIAADLL